MMLDDLIHRLRSVAEPGELRDLCKEAANELKFFEELTSPKRWSEKLCEVCGCPGQQIRMTKEDGLLALLCWKHTKEWEDHLFSSEIREGHDMAEAELESLNCVYAGHAEQLCALRSATIEHQDAHCALRDEARAWIDRKRAGHEQQHDAETATGEASDE